MAPPLRLRRILSRVLVGAGVACFASGAVGWTLARSALDPVTFGDRVAASLSDPRVSAYAADRITNAVLEESPDLVAVRPLLVTVAEGVARSDPMRDVVRSAARSAHRAVFAERTRQLVLSVPDVGVLLQSAFATTSADLADRIPETLRTLETRVDFGRGARLVIDLFDLREYVGALVTWLLVLGALLVSLAIGVAEDRRLAVLAAGLGLLCAGVAVLGIVPVGALLVEIATDDPFLGSALVGVWHTAAEGLWDWGVALAGVGVLFAAASTSLLESFRPLEQLAQVWRRLGTPPATRGNRAVWATSALVLGAAIALAPRTALALLAAALGIAVFLVGARELFRMLLDTVDAVPALQGRGAFTRPLVRTAVLTALTFGLGGAWISLRNPLEVTPLSSVSSCNGARALCDRRVNEVAFPGAHNAMSNSEIRDWMFPHHQRAIPRQLEGGVRALLIDVHAGFAGASRIKTDVEGQRPTQEILVGALGEEGLEAAMRIRERLVGADEGQRGLYLCHGFCELGAYELVPTLAEVRAFLLRHPSEVLLIVIEDYVSPRELAEAFDESGLVDRVYRGPGGPHWPSLRELVVSGHNVIVFLESGQGGVPWLRPAFEEIQETPYTFHEPGEFSCRPNRGGTAGSLFQINHWIETTPAPQPSNADLVNAADVLLARAEACREERGRLPNVLAVDFAGRGDLLRVVDTLNGVNGTARDD